MHQIKQSTGGAWLAERFNSLTGWVGHLIQSIIVGIGLFLFLYVFITHLYITLPYTLQAQMDSSSFASPSGSSPLSEGVERGIIMDDWRGGL